MNDAIEGGCLCGAVRYRCTGEAQSVGLCQCDRCQRQSGSSYLIAVVFDKNQLVIDTSGLKTFTAIDDNGAALHRHFCRECGSAIMITLDRYPDIRSIMGGSLDDKSALQPTFSIWCSSAQPWLSLPASIAQFPDYPDGLMA